MIELETDRLLLRPFRESDHAPYAAFLADEDCTRYLGGTRDAAASWRVMAANCGHWHLRGYGPFAIEEKVSGEFVGYCGPWFPHGKPEHEIMWGIMPAAQRRGFATEAAFAARAWVYDTIGWPTAVSNIMPGNAGSEGVARKLGARMDGRVTIQGVECAVWRHPGRDELGSGELSAGAAA